MSITPQPEERATIAALLKHHRERMRLTFEDVAELTGYSTLFHVSKTVCFLPRLKH